MTTTVLLITAFLLLALLLATPQLVQAKSEKGVAHLVPNKVYPIAKFSFRPVGQSVITGTVRYRGRDARGAIYLFMDTEWEHYHTSNDACTRMSKASAKIDIGSKGVEGKGWISESDVTNLEGDLHEFRFTWKIEHRVRTYGYYAVIAECSPGFQSKRMKMMEYDLMFLNDGYDHFPADEHGLFTLYVICFFALSAYAGYHYRMRKLFNQIGVPPAAISLLAVGYGCELISILMEVLHLWRYEYDGYGWHGFDFFSEVLEGFGQTAIAYLLIAFASGWTLIEGTINAKSSGMINPEALGEDHPSTLFVFVMTTVVFMIQIFNKILFYNEFTKFHDHESWPGFLLILVRILLAGFFTFQISQTLSYMNKKNQEAFSGAVHV